MDALGLNEVEADGETEALGDVLADGDTLALALTDGLNELDGDVLALGDVLADGETDALAESDGDIDGEADADGERSPHTVPTNRVYRLIVPAMATRSADGLVVTLAKLATVVGESVTPASAEC